MLQAIKILNMIKLFGKAIRVNKASQDKDTLDVGANLFIGNLDPDVDEKVCSKLVVNVNNSSFNTVLYTLLCLPTSLNLTLHLYCHACCNEFPAYNCHIASSEYMLSLRYSILLLKLC